MKPWTKLTTTERNDLIGESLGFKPATQCWISYQGKGVLITASTEETRAKAEELLQYMQRPENQAFCLAKYPSLRPEMFGKMEVTVERWHIRYCDTPGGGWCVIEWLNAKGNVDVLSEGKGEWRVCFDDRHPHHPKISIQAPTMAEAACLVALTYLGKQAPV